MMTGQPMVNYLAYAAWVRLIMANGTYPQLTVGPRRLPPPDPCTCEYLIYQAAAGTSPLWVQTLAGNQLAVEPGQWFGVFRINPGCYHHGDLRYAHAQARIHAITLLDPAGIEMERWQERVTAALYEPRPLPWQEHLDEDERT